MTIKYYTALYYSIVIWICLIVACSDGNNSKIQMPIQVQNQHQSSQSKQNLSFRQQLDTITRAISPETAIAIAEAFIIEQGYTNADSNKWQKQLVVFEKGEFASDTLQILRARYNRLQASAIAVREYGDSGGKWIVGFRPTIPENNIVRAVTLDSLAKTIVMQSQALREDWIKGQQ